MGATWGKNLRLTIFGESHGEAIGIVIDGLPPGKEFPSLRVAVNMARRAPGQWGKLTTTRRESDEFRVLSGLKDGVFTGAPLCALIANQDTHSRDYDFIKDHPRPGHSDYPAYVRFGGYNDHRGGGHFSGRLTAPLVFAGSICEELLAERRITVAAHIRQIGSVLSAPLSEECLTPLHLLELKKMPLPVSTPAAGESMIAAVLAAGERGDSLGGMLESIILGLPPGVGEPFFDSLEATLAHLLFSIPAVKAVSFGAGQDFAGMSGSEASDPYYCEDGMVKISGNHNGGALGGLSTGAPLIFQTVFKPTASISLEQDTVELSSGQPAKLTVTGRHDPCIAIRAIPVVESVAALALYDLLLC
jgi:chorismate synthase